MSGMPEAKVALVKIGCDVDGIAVTVAQDDLHLII